MPCGPGEPLGRPRALPRRTYQSNSVEVQVVGAAAVQAPPVEEGGGTTTEEPIFLRVSVSSEETYVGEPVTVSSTSTRGPGVRLSFAGLPEFQNFWAEELLTPQRPSFQTRTSEASPTAWRSSGDTRSSPCRPGRRKSTLHGQRRGGGPAAAARIHGLALGDDPSTGSSATASRRA